MKFFPYFFFSGFRTSTYRFIVDQIRGYSELVALQIDAYEQYKL